MNIDFVLVDVFSDRAFGGNQLAVIPRAEGLSDELMQQLAREFNFSETAFVLPPADPSHTGRVRIFTPGGEVPFAGHSTVGTGAALPIYHLPFPPPARVGCGSSRRAGRCLSLGTPPSARGPFSPVLNRTGARPSGDSSSKRASAPSRSTSAVRASTFASRHPDAKSLRSRRRWMPSPRPSQSPRPTWPNAGTGASGCDSASCAFVTLPPWTAPHWTRRRGPPGSAGDGPPTCTSFPANLTRVLTSTPGASRRLSRSKRTRPLVRRALVWWAASPSAHRSQTASGTYR